MSGDIYPFTPNNINAAPHSAGVYVLYDGEEIIYIGRAKGTSETIRSRLQDHHSGREGRCTQQATHYWREVTDRPVSREKELQEWYKAKHGRLPRCNDRIG